MVEVKNLKGTAGLKPTCGCDDWLDHWKTNKFTYRGVNYCYSCRRTVNEHDMVGGHVIKLHSVVDRDHYIIPICKACNNKGDNYFAVDENLLVPANCNLCILKKSYKSVIG